MRIIIAYIWILIKQMEDQDYEWFIRRAYNSPRNPSIGADVDYWRALQYANAAFVQGGAKDPSSELTDYNAKEIQIRQFIGQALGKYQEQSYLNTDQKEKLKTLHEELNISGRQQSGFGLDYLQAVIERARNVMKSELTFEVTGTGLLDQESFRQSARDEIYKLRNFFGPLKHLSLTIKQVPFDSPEGLSSTKIDFSENYTQCIAEHCFFSEYDTQGKVTGFIQPFDFRTRITQFMWDIQSRLPQPAK
jgi:hypothetical protein